jgi:hypothetical protein
MAARRLLLILLILLAISTVAAFLAPAPRDGVNDRSTPRRTTPAPRHAEEPRGRLVHASMDASEPRPATVRLHVGDQLSLRVRSDVSDQAKIAGLGLIEAVDRDAPARFNVLADTPGKFAVRLVRRHERVGTIAVEPRGPRGGRAG